MVKSQHQHRAIFCAALTAASWLLSVATTDAEERPNIVLVMADDQGWGETGYYGHPVLRTPNLDAMAQAGLRFDRFYAGGPVCSPTRATVMTGRSHNRTGVESHGFALRLQERTLAQGLKQAGYATGHFGKWHLNGLRGPGVPVLASDDHNPGAFGFDEWLSVTNFFDRNPLLSRKGVFEAFDGDSSEIVIEQASQFIAAQAKLGTPSFSVVWFGTPHSPFVAAEEDMTSFGELDRDSRNHYGELVAMDRSIGALRRSLREFGIADNTLVWYCSDNGGLPKISPSTVGGLRGYKGSLYEGGLRVPAIVEWPAGIKQPRVTSFPAATMDIFSTLADVVGLPAESMLQPQDGISLRSLFEGEIGPRKKPIPFNYQGQTAIIDNDLKLIQVGKNKLEFEIYNLAKDVSEKNNLVESETSETEKLISIFEAWKSQLDRSVAGKDYPQGRVNPGEPPPRDWSEVEAYKPYFDDWRDRPEYSARLKVK